MKTVTVLALLLSIPPAVAFGGLTGLWLPALAAGGIGFVLLLPLIATIRFGIDRLVRFGAGLLGR